MQAPDDGTVEFFVKLLSEEIGIKPEAAAQEYAAGLVEQGACMEDLEVRATFASHRRQPVARTQRHADYGSDPEQEAEPGASEARADRGGGDYAQMPHAQSEGTPISRTSTGHAELRQRSRCHGASVKPRCCGRSKPPDHAHKMHGGDGSLGVRRLNHPVLVG